MHFRVLLTFNQSLPYPRDIPDKIGHPLEKTLLFDTIESAVDGVTFVLGTPHAQTELPKLTANACVSQRWGEEETPVSSL
ncbi:MAG: hypothetical protein ACOC0N_01985 [Chroococcales cyanobacterium]